MSTKAHAAARDGAHARRSIAVALALGLATAVSLALMLSGRASAASGMRTAKAHYAQTNLVSDIPGRARITDPNLVNAWGLSASPTSPIWVADNGMDVSTLYAGASHGMPPSIVPLVVSIPGGAPTGTVFNGSEDFVVHSGSTSGPAAFLFASESGKITGWNPNVPGPAPSTQAQVARSIPGAIYKGLTLAMVGQRPFLYAANFSQRRVDVFGRRFHTVHRFGTFMKGIPRGYSPFNVQEIHGRVYVSYARHMAGEEDETAGRGLGFVDVFWPNGHLIKRLVSHGRLNAPWGLEIAPRGFGRFSGDLLVGNFGDGRIHAYSARTGAFRGTLRNRQGHPITIDGLWALRVGNGTFGSKNAVLFSAGPDDESHGLLGQLRAVR